MILFLLSYLEVLTSINSSACVLTEFINEFFYVLFEVVQNAHKYFEVLVYSTVQHSSLAVLRPSGSTVAGLLGSGADVLSWC